MDALLISKMQTTRIRDNDKHQTGFAKEAPRVSRYSLADTVSTREGMDYHLRVVTTDDREKVLKFLRRFFFRDEPLNQAIELIPEGEDSTCVELEEYILTSIKDNLSLMAVSSTGAIIGVSVNGEMVPLKDGEPDYITNCANPKFKKILKLLNHVDKQADLANKYPNQRILELRIISVDGSWRGRGVARALVEKTEILGKDHGLNVIRSDCSSLFSGKLCKRFGFGPIYELPYDEYLDEDGKPVFTPLHPHKAIVTYVKKL